MRSGWEVAADACVGSFCHFLSLVALVHSAVVKYGRKEVSGGDGPYQDNYSEDAAESPTRRLSSDPYSGSIFS